MKIAEDKIDWLKQKRDLNKHPTAGADAHIEATHDLQAPRANMRG